MRVSAPELFGNATKCRFAHSAWAVHCPADIPLHRSTRENAAIANEVWRPAVIRRVSIGRKDVPGYRLGQRSSQGRLLGRWKLAELALQRATVHSQQSGRLRDIPTAIAEDALNVLPFHARQTRYR